jgi:hypothetical protein
LFTTESRKLREMSRYIMWIQVYEKKVLKYGSVSCNKKYSMTEVWTFALSFHRGEVKMTR